MRNQLPTTARVSPASVRGTPRRSIQLSYARVRYIAGDEPLPKRCQSLSPAKSKWMRGRCPKTTQQQSIKLIHSGQIA
jgi:hypothetical protein